MKEVAVRLHGREAKEGYRDIGANEQGTNGDVEVDPSRRHFVGSGTSCCLCAP